MMNSTAMDVDLNTDVLPGFDVLEAVREGDTDSVSRYLNHGGNVNLCSANTERTLLHIACRQGYAEMVTLLLSHGANASVSTLRHLTPLHLAAHEGHFQVARLLLEAWACVDDRDGAGNTPLHLAARKGHGDVVRLLLQCGADKKGIEESGWTALHFAVWNGHTPVTRMLLQAGADPRVCDLTDKSTPLHLACSSGHPEVAKLLIEFAADSFAMDAKGALPDHVIGASCSDEIPPSIARELSEIVVGHRTRQQGKSGISLECVVDSLRAKVYELEDQLSRAGRHRLEYDACANDRHRQTFSAAFKPECPICQTDVKKAVLDPCRHLAVCCSCVNSLKSCPFCACPVSGYHICEGTDTAGYISMLQDEGAQLRVQLERFSSRMRQLVVTNGDLKLELRRARAEASVLVEEKIVIEERLLASPLPAPPPRRLNVTKGDVAADTDCDSGSGYKPVARNYRSRNSTHSERELVSPVDPVSIPANGNEQVSNYSSALGPIRVEPSSGNDSLRPPAIEIPKEPFEPYCQKRPPRGARMSSSACGPCPIPPGVDADLRPSVGRAKDGGGGTSFKAITANGSRRSKCCSPSSTERSSPSPENSTSPRRSRRAARFGRSRKGGRRATPPIRTRRAEGGDSDNGSSMIMSESSLSPASLQRLESKQHNLSIRVERRGVSERCWTASEERNFVEAQRPPSSLPRDPTSENARGTGCPSRWEEGEDTNNRKAWSSC